MYCSAVVKHCGTWTLLYFTDHRYLILYVYKHIYIYIHVYWNLYKERQNIGVSHHSFSSSKNQSQDGIDRVIVHCVVCKYRWVLDRSTGEPSRRNLQGFYGGTKTGWAPVPYCSKLYYYNILYYTALYYYYYYTLLCLSTILLRTALHYIYFTRKKRLDLPWRHRDRVCLTCRPSVETQRHSDSLYFTKRKCLNLRWRRRDRVSLTFGPSVETHRDRQAPVLHCATPFYALYLTIRRYTTL